MWLLFLLLCLYFRLISTQSCSDGLQVFSRFPGRFINENVYQNSVVLLQEPESAITLGCIDLCKSKPDCSSFNVDHANSTCSSFSEDDSEKFESTTKHSIAFQKVCYQNTTKEILQQLCGGRGWTFDITADASLEGFSATTFSDIESRPKCELLCINHDEYQCASANYLPSSKECQLSRETRRSQPQAFRTGLNSSLYLENQCLPPRPAPCRYQKIQDVKFVTYDSLVYAKNYSECQKQCDLTTEFICRSYTFKETKCFLSSDDHFTKLPSNSIPDRGSISADVICPTDDCVRGVWTYEISPDHTLTGSDQSPFDEMETGLLDNSHDCRSVCDRKGYLCPAFIINHQHNGNCYNLDRNSQGRSIQLAPSYGTAYFEKVCLKFPDGQSCKRKLWSFTRIPGHQLDMDRYYMTLEIITSRRDCEQKCLDSNCSSALYDETSVTCRLSNETRFSARLNKNFNLKVSYLENNCLSTEKTNHSCEWKATHHAVSSIKDMVIVNVTNEDTCRENCQSNNKFLCLSYSYNQQDGKCILSSETRKTKTSSWISSARGNWTSFDLKCKSDTSTEPTEVVTQTEEPMPNPDQTIRNQSFCRLDSDVVFERIPGFEPIGNVYLASLCHGTADNPGIVKSCKDMCLHLTNCRGFVIDYSKKHCIGVISKHTIERNQLKVAEEKDFFLMDCLPKAINCPQKIWSFESIIDQTINPAYPPRYILPFISRPACQCLCLEERKFTCRSIVHERRGNICRMYDRDRGSNESPLFSLMFSQGSEYLENSCTDTMSSHQVCRYSVHRDDVTIRSLIHSLQVLSLSECRRACDSETSFLCRSFSFVDRVLYSLHGKNLCLLSSDNESSSKDGSLRFSPRSFYYQRHCRTT